jgi:isocitrate dehydrogenase
LRWDSLGEFLALAESLRFIGNKNPNEKKLATLISTLDIANDGYLDNNKAPSRKVGEPDNKASHFFVAQYCAKALAESDNSELAEKFAPVAKALEENEDKIISELLAFEPEFDKKYFIKRPCVRCLRQVQKYKKRENLYLFEKN